LKAVYAVLSQGYVLAYGSRAGAIALYAASALAWLAAGYVTFRRRARWAWSDFLGFAAGVAIILAWTLSFQTHSTIHSGGWFAC
jgi:putative flippase GtrA